MTARLQGVLDWSSVTSQLYTQPQFTAINRELSRRGNVLSAVNSRVCLILFYRYRLFLFWVFTTNYAQNSGIVSNTLQKKIKKITLTRPKNRTRDPVLQKISNNLHVTIPARLSELTFALRFNQNLLSAQPCSEQMCQFKEKINQICDFWPVKM